MHASPVPSLHTTRTTEASAAVPYRTQVVKSHPSKRDLRGIIELADDDDGDTYRVYYSLKCPGIVYVLYAHKKKSKRGIGIPKDEEDLILQRFKHAMAECKEQESTQ